MNSSEFADFQQKYKDSFVVAGFFVLDLESGKNVHQIDYYVPSEKKVAAFTLDDKVTVQLMKTIGKQNPEKLDIDTKIDLDAIEGILEDEMKNRSITEKIKKIIAVLQNVKGRKLWNINCVLSGMEILRAHVDDDSKTVLKMEKASIMDYIQKIPGGRQAALAGALPKDGKSASPEEAKVTIKKLEDLEKAIEKEKEEYKKQLSSPKEAGKKEAKNEGKIKKKA